jgi:hypothetical protein
MFKIFRKIASNKTCPAERYNVNNPVLRYPHYNATIIQLGWLGSPRYRKLLKKKLKKRRRRDYKHYAAITIQCAWFKSRLYRKKYVENRLYRKKYVEKINQLLSRVERLDIEFVDEYIHGIERLILKTDSSARLSALLQSLAQTVTGNTPAQEQ